MSYSGYELLWLFLAYSFIGWILETVTAAFKQKRFVNRGLINGPFCVTYGLAMSVITIFGQELHGFWLFLGSMIIAGVIEWTAGRLVEKIFHERWWDYSNVRWNLDGYICIPMLIVWGILCTAAIVWANPFLLRICHMIPGVAGVILVWILFLILTLDALASLIILSGKSKRAHKWQTIDTWMNGISLRMGGWVYEGLRRRIDKAYPQTEYKEDAQNVPEVFATGCSFYKLFWLFLTGAFLGDVVETVFCRITMGRWMSRSSLVWGPFSVVWGLAIAGATLLLYKYRNRSDGFLFVTGTFLGGAYEYICSVFTEILFGRVFWDYSNIPFNLGGRINLLYCFFWGIAAVVWFKGLYPVFSALIEKIPVRTGKILTWLLLLFMCCNAAVSSLALIRSEQRKSGEEASYQWQEIMDERFDDERLKRIYPNALDVE